MIGNPEISPCIDFELVQKDYHKGLFYEKQLANMQKSGTHERQLRMATLRNVQREMNFSTRILEFILSGPINKSMHSRIRAVIRKILHSHSRMNFSVTTA